MAGCQSTSSCFSRVRKNRVRPTCIPSSPPIKTCSKPILLILCDGGFEPDLPTIAYAGRGIVGAEVTVTGPDHDLHSGVYGGVVHNPLHVVGKIIGFISRRCGRIQLPGYYDPVRKLSDDELANLQKDWGLTREQYLAQSGAKHLWAEAMGSFPVRGTALPTLKSTGSGAAIRGRERKPCIPSKAGFKVTMRLVKRPESRRHRRDIHEICAEFCQRHRRHRGEDSGAGLRLSGDCSTARASKRCSRRW